MKITRDFVRDERAVAFVEYLSLLGLLVGGAIVAVTIMGHSLAGAFHSWSKMLETASLSESSGGSSSGYTTGSGSVGSDSSADATGETSNTASGPGNSANSNGSGNGSSRSASGKGNRKP